MKCLKVHKPVILPDVLYACGTSFLSLREKAGLGIWKQNAEEYIPEITDRLKKTLKSLIVLFTE